MTARPIEVLRPKCHYTPTSQQASGDNNNDKEKEQNIFDVQIHIIHAMM